MTDDLMLDVSNLDVSYGRTQVLYGVSLALGRNETVGLVGRNGAGKSTTLKAIMGMIPVVDGTITFLGDDYTNATARKRPLNGIGFAPEDRRLFSHLSVEENFLIAAWGANSNLTDAAFDGLVEQILEVFPELEELLDRPARALSGGQQQMVTVGRALATDPILLLLDEPFEGLAPVVRQKFRNGIEQIKALDVSLLIAESNIKNIEPIIDRGYVIERGEIRAEVGQDELFSDHPEVKRIFEGA